MRTRRVNVCISESGYKETITRQRGEVMYICVLKREYRVDKSEIKVRSKGCEGHTLITLSRKLLLLLPA